VSDSESGAGLPEGNSAQENTRSDPAVDALFSDSLQRIERLIPVLAVVLGAALAGRGDWRVGLGVLAGAAVAYVNFRWLKSTVMALADVITGSGGHASRPSVVLRFLTRFVLIALVAYGILVSYPAAFRGFLGGLFVPVLAIFVEAAYVVFASIRRGF
jgi:hypothetical protein